MSEVINPDDLDAALLARLFEAGQRGETVVTTQTFTTKLGLHRISEILLDCADENGLDVENSHDGGIFTRTHTLKIRGNTWDVVQMALQLDGILKGFSR